MCTTFSVVAILVSMVAAQTGEIQIRVVDAATKQPIAARVWLQAADGSYPGDRIGLVHDKWPNLDAHAVFIDGEKTFTLPPGKTLLKISRGPQYELVEREVEVAADKQVMLDIALKKVIDLRARGWVAGDAHLHMIHGEMQRATSYEDVALTCRAGGLEWAYVNQEYSGAGEHTLADFHAECRKVSRDGFQLLLGGERPKSLLGHNALLGVTDPFVIPDDPPYHRAAVAIHQQGGVLFPVHPLRYFPGKQYLGQWLDFPGNNLGREIVFDAYLGPSFDGLSVLSDQPNDQRAHRLWFNLLNKGLFVPAMADSDACFDRPKFERNTPGFWNTFVYVGEGGKVDNRQLAHAVREGRTMATTGPLLLWDIDGKTSGDTLLPDGTEREVHIQAWHAHHNWTLSPARLGKVELLRNGKVVRVWEPGTPDAVVSMNIQEKEACWYAVRAYGTDDRWQVAVTSPIYFRATPAQRKKQPLKVTVRGRVYDFTSGDEKPAKMLVKQHDKVLKEFATDGQFAVEMPLDATLTAIGSKGEEVTHDLLLDYGPVHRFLWKLDSEALSKPETFEQFESLLKDLQLEFPLGYKMSGCYSAVDLKQAAAIESVRVTAAPKVDTSAPAVAAVLLDKSQVAPGDIVNVAVVFHGSGTDDPQLVVEGRAYDAQRPTGFNPLKVFGTVESKWSAASEAGEGYRFITGKLAIPDWAQAGAVDAIEINAMARGKGGKFESHVGMRLPLGRTSRQLMVVSNWPTVPISWHDHNYGIGPLKVCGKLGRAGQPQVDYRALTMKLRTSAGDFEVSPAQDGTGCADADDAVYTGHYFDQVLNDESKLLPLTAPRAQPPVAWRKLTIIDATMK